ncbi:hypothetical protein DDI_0378 [Dickeya dianthicola RNS04.9]|nr:hypothetical protein DDI_0378 [Dickeya dianthicola RNS04.9]
MSLFDVIKYLVYWFTIKSINSPSSLLVHHQAVCCLSK